MSPKCMVRVNGSLSSAFNLERGVLQGSVLSPALFLLIMDPLLKSLQSKGLGPSVGGTYAGAFIHADDIRTISSSRATLQEQIDTVCKFAVDNGLSLNPTKCEVVLVSPSKPEESAPIAILGGKALTPHLNASVSDTGGPGTSLPPKQWTKPSNKQEEHFSPSVQWELFKGSESRFNKEHI